MSSESLSRIDFYVVSDSHLNARHLFVCRLAEKIYRLGHKVFIRTSTPSEATELDALMWTFRVGSFLPHSLTGMDAETPMSPLLIGHQEGPECSADLLINLAPSVPSAFRQYQRVAEIVDQDAAVKEAGRQRYRFYRDQGFTVDTHAVSVSSSDE